MSDQIDFNGCILQWLRLLALDKSLSARAVQFGVYLAVYRYNSAKKFAWPSQITICNDLGLKSTKTISRIAAELEKNWIDVARGSQGAGSIRYSPSLKSINLAAELKNTSARRVKGRQICPNERTFSQQVSGQKYPPNENNENIEVRLRDDSSFFVKRKSFGEKLWRDFVADVFGCDIDRLLASRTIEGRSGYFLPSQFPPTDRAQWHSVKIQIIQQLECGGD